jgi:hypothetical protein
MTTFPSASCSTRLQVDAQQTMAARTRAGLVGQTVCKGRLADSVIASHQFVRTRNVQMLMV